MAEIDFLSPYLNPSLAATVAALTLLGWVYKKRSQDERTPPGPPQIWPLGNALDVPKSDEWLPWVKKWKDEYGPIVSLNVLGELIVILNSPESISQILEKRSAVTAGRTRLVMLGEMCGFENSILGLQHNARHKEARKYLNQTVGKGNLSKHHSLVESEIVKLVVNLMDVNSTFGSKDAKDVNGTDTGTKNVKDDIVAIIRHSVGSIILAITYGLKPQEKDDPHIRDAELALVPLNIGLQPGAFLVDNFPVLRYVPSWFPGASWKRLAVGWAGDVRRLLDNPIGIVKNELAQGVHKESVAHTMLLDQAPDQNREEQIKWTCLSLYTGGADTTVSAIHAFILAMILHPHVQKRAQEEIDMVIGSGRLPNLNDRTQGSLPYVEAIMNEVLRWHNVTPFSAPHVLTEEQVFERYFFPKGTVFIGNIWGIMHDEKYFSRPLEFLPERFLQRQSQTQSDSLDEKDRNSHPDARLDPWNYAFGFGRRVCPGRDLAVMELWLAIATILATLDISKARDERGNEIEPIVEFTQGAISHPVPFNCTIEPRSSRTATMIRNAVSTLAE